MRSSVGRNVILSLLVVFFCIGGASAQVGDQNKLSDCLKGCLRALVKLDRSFTYQFLNFDKVCDTLEKAANCQTKCSLQDQKAFYQFTSFYRLHCVEFEEELEEQMPCLRTIVSQVDKMCNAKCEFKADKTMSKEAKMKATCKQIECNTICYYENFSKHCPSAKKTLMAINLRQTQELANTASSEQVAEMEAECRNIHDLNYMKMKFVAI